MNRFRFALKYCCHFITARHTRGFGVHSPFIYHFIRFVLPSKHSFYVFHSIERMRSELKADDTQIKVTDFGTGIDRTTTVRKIAGNSLKSPRYAQLLFRIVRCFKARKVLELGTSLGVTTSYLAASSSDIRCVSFEGCPQLAKLANDNFKKIGLTNIELIIGNIDLTLEKALKEIDEIDFIFIDANHRSEAVMNYFEMCLSKIHKNTVLVVDDIYWSSDMETAWKLIKEHQRVSATIDLFQLGIVFFNTDLHKKHYKIRY